MSSQAPAQTLAAHLVSQTLSSVAVLEQLNIITADDAATIRARLPNQYATFPQLAAAPAAAAVASPYSPVNNVSAMTNQLNTLAVSPTVAPAARQSPGLPPRQPVPAATDTQPRARALWDYSGAEADDLQFRQGDIIIIDEEVNEQWYRGRVVPPGCAPNEKGGLFPSNYVEKLAPGAQSPGYVPPAAPAYGTTNSYYQAPGSQEKSQYGGYQPPAQQYQPEQQQQQQQPTTIVVQGEDESKKGKFGKYKGQLGNAAVTGAGFGFGSAVASNLVNAIL